MSIFGELFEQVQAIEEFQMQALVQRLGIESQSENDREWIEFLNWRLQRDDLKTWAKLGYVLAREQPEFTGKRRGRKKKKLFEVLDIQRAKFVAAVKSGLLAKVPREFRAVIRKQPDSEIIEIAQREKVPLFPASVSVEALKNSVARGNKKLITKK